MLHLLEILVNRPKSQINETSICYFFFVNEYIEGIEPF